MKFNVVLEAAEEGGYTVTGDAKIVVSNTNVRIINEVCIFPISFQRLQAVKP